MLAMNFTRCHILTVDRHDIIPLRHGDSCCRIRIRDLDLFSDGAEWTVDDVLNQGILGKYGTQDPLMKHVAQGTMSGQHAIDLIERFVQSSRCRLGETDRARDHVFSSFESFELGDVRGYLKAYYAHGVFAGYDARESDMKALYDELRQYRCLDYFGGMSFTDAHYLTFRKQ